MEYDEIGKFDNEVNLINNMNSTVLLVLTEEFNDMALLANQVMLSENNHDVIIASKENSAIKGQESSVLAITLDEALSHGVDYSAVIIVGGKMINHWEELKNFVRQMSEMNRVIGALGSGIELIRDLQLTSDLSQAEEIVISDNIITLHDADLAEEFVNSLLPMI